MMAITLPPSQFSSKLLITKLTAPVYLERSVSRARLTDMLIQGMKCKLTLLVAPAGYGKTTLLSEWNALVKNIPWTIAWLKLDKEDDGIQFWYYFIGALRSIYPDLYQDDFEGIGSQSDTVNTVELNLLLNRLTAFPGEFSLVLDDYHLIQNEIVHQNLAYIVDHIPENMHLVISSRTTPPLKLARLRAQGQLVEIQMEDLAFNYDEIELFLYQITKTQAEEEDVKTLAKVTEGWIAGVRMAVLSAKSGRKLKILLQDFSGSNRNIMDYLTEEVLNQQPDEIRSFLIKSSLLSSLTAPLCDAVLGITNSREKLILLENSYSLLIPLDQERRWYRYHALFREYLKNALSQTDPDDIESMHRRAGKWWRENGYPEQAILHAMAINDFDNAADIAEECLSQHLLCPTLIQITRYVENLPVEVLRKKTRLVIRLLSSRVVLAQKIELTRLVKEFADIITNATDPNSEEAGNNYKAALFARALTTCVLGDYDQSIRFSQQALALFGPEEYSMAGALSHYSHFAYAANGKFDEAAAMLQNARKISETLGFDQEYISVTCSLARIYKCRGWLYEAEKLYLHVLDYANRKAIDPEIIYFIQVGLSDIYLEWNQLNEADSLVLFFPMRYSRYEISYLEWNYCVDYALILAKNYLAHKDYEKARGHVEVSNSRHLHCNKVPFRAAILKDLEVRTWIASQELSRLARWITEMNTRRTRPGEHIASIEKIAIARANLALGRSRQALDILLELTKNGHAVWLVEYQITILLIKAMAMVQLGEKDCARGALLQAIKLAEPGRYTRIFIDFGLPMKNLLVEVLQNLGRKAHEGVSYLKIIDYLKMLTLQFDVSTDKKVKHEVVPEMATHIDQLSRRENEVLKLIVEGHNPKEISKKLTLSIHTTRAHIKNIYQKLDVHTREEAIEKAILFSA